MQTKKLYPSPNLKLNPNCNLSSNPNDNPNPNSKYILQLTTNVNNLENKRVFEQMSTNFALLFFIRSAHLHARVQIGTSFEKIPKD